jgi:RHS repeat-associated protein
MGTVAYGYDALNRRTSMSDSLGNHTFTYANFGAFDSALASESGPWAGDTVSYGYSGKVLASIGVGSWSETIAHDIALRPHMITSPAGTFTYMFSGGGRQVGSLQMPGSTTTLGYDDVGQLNAIEVKNASQTVLDYHGYDRNQNGWITRAYRMNGVTVDYGYDNIGQLASAQGHEADSTLRLNENLGYTYDASGNLATRIQNTLQQSFTSDPADQLTSVTRSGTLTVEGSFSGAVATLGVNGQPAALYSDGTFATTAGLSLHDGNNLFVTAGSNAAGALVLSTVSPTRLPVSTTFTYDSNGNLLSDGRKIYSYDDANELLSVSVPGEWKAEFVYDGLLRRRITRDYAWQAGGWTKTNETRYICDRMLVLQERDASNNPLVTYTRGLDLSGTFQGAGGIGSLLARTDAGGSAFYHSDLGGNVTSLTDGNGSVTARYLYDPYGRLLGKWGPMADANRYQFSSKEQHPSSGLYYYRFRFYESGLQRWLNRDLIGENGGLNLYGFVGNNPLRWVDPYGLDYGDLWDPRTWFNGGFWGSIGDQVGSVGGTLKDTFTGDWGNIQNRYDDSTLGQAEAAGPKTYLATKVCLGTATAATAAAATVGGVEYFALGNQSLAEFNVLSEGNVFKVISRPLKGGFRVDPAHHGKPWGHTHWWGW